jgi:hypothetical protein
MKLNESQISKTLDQFRAQVLADHHPAIADFCELFGHHTFFLDASGSTCWSCSKFLGSRLSKPC